jgi:hypothetical protein
MTPVFGQPPVNQFNMAQPSFNFGAQSAAAPGQPFSFSAAPADPASGSFGGQPSRAIKKAKRRLGGPV